MINKTKTRKKEPERERDTHRQRARERERVRTEKANVRVKVVRGAISPMHAHVVFIIQRKLHGPITYRCMHTSSHTTLKPAKHQRICVSATPCVRVSFRKNTSFSLLLTIHVKGKHHTYQVKASPYTSSESNTDEVKASPYTSSQSITINIHVEHSNTYTDVFIHKHNRCTCATFIYIHRRLRAKTDRAKQQKQLSKDHTRAHARTLACCTVLNAKSKDAVLVTADKRVCAPPDRLPVWSNSRKPNKHTQEHSHVHADTRTHGHATHCGAQTHRPVWRTPQFDCAGPVR